MQVKEENLIPKIIEEVSKLSKMRIEIGVFGEDDSFMSMIASVNEFGANIKAKKKYMTIPLMKKYKGKSPRDFDLFFFRAKSGNSFLVREKGKDKLEFAYMLVKEINIPERSFIRSTFDEKEQEWYKYSLILLSKVLSGQSTAEELCENMGSVIQKDIQKKIRDIKTPPNAPSTIARKGSSNPLIDTGLLHQSVTYKVRG